MQLVLHVAQVVDALHIHLIDASMLLLRVLELPIATPAATALESRSPPSSASPAEDPVKRSPKRLEKELISLDFDMIPAYIFDKKRRFSGLQLLLLQQLLYL